MDRKFDCNSAGRMEEDHPIVGTRGVQSLQVGPARTSGDGTFSFVRLPLTHMTGLAGGWIGRSDGVFAP